MKNLMGLEALQSYDSGIWEMAIFAYFWWKVSIYSDSSV